MTNKTIYIRPVDAPGITELLGRDPEAITRPFKRIIKARGTIMPLSLEEAKLMRLDVQKTITRAISHFADATDFRIADIELRRTDVTSLGDETRRYIYDVALRVELDVALRVEL